MIKILVVENDSGICQIVQELLDNKEKYTIDYCGSVDKALELFKFNIDDPYAIVIIDIAIPDKEEHITCKNDNGYHLVQAIKIRNFNLSRTQEHIYTKFYQFKKYLFSRVLYSQFILLTTPSYKKYNEYNSVLYDKKSSNILLVEKGTRFAKGLLEKVKQAEKKYVYSLYNSTRFMFIIPTVFIIFIIIELFQKGGFLTGFILTVVILFSYILYFYNQLFMLSPKNSITKEKFTND